MKQDYHMIRRQEDAIIFYGPRKKILVVNIPTAEKFERYMQAGVADSDIQQYIENLEQEERYEIQNRTVPPILERLSILTTQTCNCCCKYCFATEGTYNDSSQTVISEEVCEATFQYLYDNYPLGIKLIQFFGGEPLIGMAVIKKAVECCKKQAMLHNVKPPIFTVVTNGTLFDKDNINYFNQENFEVVVSIDGNKELNDCARISKEGFSVFDRIEASLIQVNQIRKFHLFAEATFNQYHIKSYKKGIVKIWLDAIRNLGIDGIIVGVVDSDYDELKITSQDQETFRQMYREVVDYYFDLMAEEDPAVIPPDLFSLIRNLLKKEQSYPCAAGYGNVAVSTKGDLYPCYQFAVNQDYKLAGMEDGVMVPTKNLENIQKLFTDLKATRPKECSECWMSSVCNIWCRGMSYNRYHDISHISESRCWIIEVATERIIEKIVELQQNPEEYKAFVTKMLTKNKVYSYNAFYREV